MSRTVGLPATLLAIALALPAGVASAQNPQSGPPDAPAADPLPDEVPGAQLEGIAPGASHSGHVRRELGLPERWVERACERFHCAARGIAQADVGYGEDGLVIWARIEFKKELAPDSAAVVFWLSGTPRRVRGDAFGEGATAGSTVHHDERGVHLHVVDDVVRAAWMTLPDADLARVGAQARAARAKLDAAAPTEPTAPPAEPGAAELPPRGSLFDPNFQPATPQPAAVRRRLQVLSTRFQTHELEGEQGFLILAQVHADGMKDRELKGRLRFLLPNGQYYAAPRGTRYRDERGRATITTQDKILYDEAKWGSFHFFVPFALVRGRNDLRALFMVSCAGLNAYAVSEVPLSPLALRNWPGRRLRGIAHGAITIKPGVKTNVGPVLQMQTAVDVTHVGSRDVLGSVRLRAFPATPQQQNSRRLLPPAPGPDAKIWNDGSGNLRALNALQRSADGGAAGPLQVLVPYVRIGIAPGRHRLVLELRISCGNLSSLSEIEVEIEKQ